MLHAALTFREADRAELAAVLTVQRQAFGRVAHDYGIPPEALPPLTEGIGDLATLMDGGTRFFVAIDAAGAIVGAVRGRTVDGLTHVGRLVVADAYVRRGVATRLMDLLEDSMHSTRTFELFTGEDALAPLSLYLKRGYQIVRRDDSGPVALVWLEKPVVS